MGEVPISCECVVCGCFWSDCRCEFQHILVPMNHNVRCNDDTLAALFQLRTPLIRRLCFNVLHFLGLMGPLHCVDCFLHYHDVTLLIYYVWVMWQVMVPGLDNWCSMVPTAVGVTLGHFLHLDMDLFCNGANNLYTRFAVDPDSPLRFLASDMDKDAFACIAEHGRSLRACATLPLVVGLHDVW